MMTPRLLLPITTLLALSACGQGKTIEIPATSGDAEPVATSTTTAEAPVAAPPEQPPAPIYAPTPPAPAAAPPANGAVPYDMSKD